MNLKETFTILAYHSIRSDRGYVIDVTQENFEQQMAYLKATGFNILTLEELILRLKKSTPLPPKSLAITFDDAHEDNIRIALPILKKYNFPATIFVPPYFLGKKAGVKTLGNGKQWFDLQEAPASYQGPIYEIATQEKIQVWLDEGLQIASHGLSHKSLTELNDQELKDELKHSKESLNDLFSIHSNLFCYPFGHYNSQIERALEKYGYEAAFVTQYTHTPSGTLNTSPFNIKRMGIYYSESLRKFKFKATGGYDRLSESILWPAWQTCAALKKALKA